MTHSARRGFIFQNGVLVPPWMAQDRQSGRRDAAGGSAGGLSSFEEGREVLKDADLETRRKIATESRSLAGGQEGLARVEFRMEPDSMDEEKGTIVHPLAEFRKFNQHNDLNLNGCFERAIEKRHTGRESSRIKPNWDHDRSQPVGKTLHLEETKDHLMGETQILGHKSTERGRWYWLMLKERAMDGVSIEFYWLTSEYRWMRADEYELSDLGTPDDWWFEPREFRHVDMHGYGFVLHPSADDVRTEEIRSISASIQRHMYSTFVANPWGEERRRRTTDAEPANPPKTEERRTDPTPQNMKEPPASKGGGAEEGDGHRSAQDGKDAALLEELRAFATDLEEKPQSEEQRKQAEWEALAASL